MNIVKQKIRGKTYVYIRESFWDPVRKKYSSRNVKSYGNLEDLLKQNPHFLEDLEKEMAALRSDRLSNKERKVAELAKCVKMDVLRGLNAQADNRCTMLGAYVIKRLWDKLALSRKLRDLQKTTNFSVDIPKAAFFMTAARCLMPDSKLAQWKKRCQILSGAQELKLQDLYRSLDFLQDHKEALLAYLNRKVSQAYQREITVALYDVTTYFFESQDADTLRNFGFSKDNKVNQVQVVMGLLIDQNGVPIDYELFPGNQNEFGTMLPILKKLKSRYRVKKLIVVADRGLNSASNLYELKEEQMDYVIAYRLRNAGCRIKKLIEDDAGWIHRRSDSLSDIAKFKLTDEARKVVIEQNGEKRTVEIRSHLLINYSAKQARKDRHDRERLIAKAQRLADHPALLRSELKRGGRSFLNIRADGVSAEVDQAKIESAEFWDGYYGIVYSDSTMTPEQVLSTHHSLWKIEESFRIAKSLLNARPCFHWKEKRIRGHFLICYLALTLHRLLELELANCGEELSSERIFEALQGAMVTEIQLSPDEVVYAKSQTEGDFATICRAVGLGEIPRISKETELKAALKVKTL